MSAPWMPLYVGDYLADTRGLSAIEHGAYLLLIMEYWQTGGLPDDEGRLARIAAVSDKEWRAIRPTILRFFLPGWKHKRVEEEFAKRDVKSEKARQSASRRWPDKPPDPPMRSHSDGSANVDRTHEKRMVSSMPDGDARAMLLQLQRKKERKEESSPDSNSTSYVGLVENQHSKEVDTGDEKQDRIVKFARGRP